MSEKNDNKVPNVPNLRFSGFTDEWVKNKLSNIAIIVDGTHQKPKYQDDGIKFASVENINNPYLSDKFISEEDYKENYKLKPRINDILMTRITAGIIGETYVIDKTEPLAYYVSLALIRPCIGYNSEFLSTNIHTYRFRKELDKRIIKVAFPQKINLNDIGECSIYTCSLKEQEKIVKIFKVIDEKISTQNKIISNLESLIKGIRQRIFSASNFDIRNSKEYELGSFLSEYSKKNVENNLISVSVGKYGIRRRDEIYSKELSDDYSKNKVIEKDSLIIGMGSTQIDIGILSKDEKYCVSPAYTTYKISGINSDYLREYLIHLNGLLSKRYMVIGARQGKSVNKSELMQHVLLVHSTEKQLKIVDIFNVFYDKLQKEKDILSLYKKQKAYLLSNTPVMVGN